ncbi:MAG: hypothetical protein WBS24_12380 [Terriglobales bacterium]
MNVVQFIWQDHDQVLIHAGAPSAAAQNMCSFGAYPKRHEPEGVAAGATGLAFFETWDSTAASIV